MLRISEARNAGSAKSYYTDALGRGDYYLDGQEIAGEWGGRGAEALGMQGQVDRLRFFQLCDNVNPATGEHLTPKTKAERRPGYDFTFSAKKSVSVAYELTGDERIRDAFTEAVRDTMKEMETEMKTRVRTRGREEDRVTGNMVWAEFTHLTTRPIDGRPDPHLHMHVFVPNATFDPKEARWKAGQFGDLKRDARYYEAAFDARLAANLNELGIATEKDDRYGFRLAGMDRAITEKFSRRTAEVEARAKELGISDAEEKARLGERTRKRKSKAEAMTRSDLREAWAQRLTDAERQQVRDVASGKGWSDAPRISAEDAYAYAVDHSFERASAVPEKRLKEEALRHGAGSVRVHELEAITRRDDLVRMERDGERICMTREVCREEMEMLRAVREGQGAYARFGNGLDGLATLDGEQKAAALHVVKSRDFVTGVRGGAGTGKTHMMRATVNSIEQGSLPGTRHSKVHVFAPTTQAVGVLRKDGFDNAQTVAKLLTDPKAQEQVRGQVMWVDEAGLMGSRTTGQLFAIAEQQGCRVILSGDSRQHNAVERGDALRLLEGDGGVRFAELRTIRRQKDAGYKEAVEAISQGKIASGYERLNALGAVKQVRGERRYQVAADAYLKAQDEGKSALLVAPTRAEGQKLTQLVREELKKRDALGNYAPAYATLDSTDWTTAQRQDARNYEPGQVVQFSGKAGGFKGGDRARVEEIKHGQDASRVVLTRDNGAKEYLPIEKASEFQVYRQREIRVAEGDTIRITRNGHGKRQRVLTPSEEGMKLAEFKRGTFGNGMTAKVNGFTPGGDLRLSNGMVLPKDYGHFEYGYVDTSYRSQGKTCDRVILVAGSESRKAANREQFYVSVSRGRDSALIVTDDRQKLLGAVEKTSARPTATEVLEGKPFRYRSLQDLRGQLLERSRIGRYMKSRYEAASDSWQQRVEESRQRGMRYGHG